MGAAMLLALAAQVRVLTLADAIQTAKARQPQLAQAHANTNVARARADEARSALLPQVSLTGLYQRTTANFVARPGAVPKSVSSGAAGTAEPTFQMFNFYNFGVTANQYIWDFGQTTDRWNAAKVQIDALSDTEQATQLQVVLVVETAFFNARAQKALVEVAKETLANQQRHLTQTQGFVKAGTHPEIDLAQSETDTANAEVQLINSQNAYDIARVQLNQAMGITGPVDFEVADEWLTPVQGEAQATEALVTEAEKARPDLASLEQQMTAQQLTIASVKGAYWPSLGFSAAYTDGGTEFSGLAWNLSASVSLSWPVFQGFLTKSQVSEAQATYVSLQSQRDVIKLQIQTDVTQAQLQVKAAQAAEVAATTALNNAQLRLRLAEARYTQGVGNAIELGDAQLALTTAAGQKIQADYSISTARASLLRAVGRRQ